jgi:hypothetical protein
MCSHFATFRRRVWLTLVVEKFVLPYHLMHFSVLLLSWHHMYGKSAQFDTGLILFFSSYFCLIYLDFHVVHK